MTTSWPPLPKTRMASCAVVAMNPTALELKIKLFTPDTES